MEEPTNSKTLATPEKIGEAESIAHQLNDVVAMLDKELVLLRDRLANVMPDVPVLEPGETAQASARKTKLGGQLDTALYRVEQSVQVVRAIRNNLEN